MKTKFFKVFYFKLQNALFRGSTNFFSSFFSDSALKTIDAQMLCRFVFLKTYKTPKTAKMECLTVNNFSQCVFKNTDQKNICASIVFKAESKPKHEEKYFGGVFFKNQKCTFSGVQNGTYFLKVKFQICIFAFVLYVKGSFMPIFIKKILIFGSPGMFLKIKTLTHVQCAPALAENLDLDFQNDLWLVDLF